MDTLDIPYNLQIVWKMNKLRYKDNDPQGNNYAFKMREEMCKIIYLVKLGKLPNLALSIYNRAVLDWQEDSGCTIEDAENHVYNTIIGFSLRIDDAVARKLYSAVDLTVDRDFYFQPDYQDKLIQKALDDILYYCRISAQHSY